MTAYSIEDLVSQAESEGVPLANLLMSRLSATELDIMQSELAERISDSYRSIESFMADVEVPSVAGLSDMSSAELDEVQREVLSALSDDALRAHA